MKSIEFNRLIRFTFSGLIDYKYCFIFETFNYKNADLYIICKVYTSVIQ